MQRTLSGSTGQAALLRPDCHPQAGRVLEAGLRERQLPGRRLLRQCPCDQFQGLLNIVDTDTQRADDAEVSLTEGALSRGQMPPPGGRYRNWVCAHTLH